MYITKNVNKYVVFSEDSVTDVLKKINDNKSRIVFVVSGHGVLLGSISDGDIRRWLLNSDNFDINMPALNLMNLDCKQVTIETEKQDYLEFFRDGVDCIPVVDSYGHIAHLAFRESEGFFIGEREISEKAATFVIAEIGNNHQGDPKLAKELVDLAAESGADCVKFQMRNISRLYTDQGKSDGSATDLGAQYTMDLLSKFQLSDRGLFDVFDYAKERGILPLCTPWDLDSLVKLEGYGMPAYKVASADFTNYELLGEIAKTGKPFFCSTGMSSETEIINTVEFLEKSGADYVLLHCNSTYPAPFKDVNLKYLTRLKKITGRLVGYSGHERGICVPIAAVALGACVIEKHFTIDKSLEGTDHKVSLLPAELDSMIKQIRELEEGLGSDTKPREITQGELLNRESLAKSLVAKEGVKRGDLILRSMVICKSPGQGLQPNRLDDLVGRAALRDVEKGGFFYESDISGVIEKKSVYKFNRPFGVPVRYHDFRTIIANSNLDFVEFHLSYNDLDLDINDFFQSDESLGFAVHAPELFRGDHILDLCAEDEEYRNRSIHELSRVVKITRDITKFFPKTKKPVIVVNAGGWNSSGFFDPILKPNKYELMAQSLASINLSGVQIAIQTMPPFPWHFGGQSYHNMFVCADEIKRFCETNNSISICLDVSHAMMACNYYGWDLYDYITKLSPFVVHMHVVDAKGVDGEGVDVGCGDVDFYRLADLLNRDYSQIQFIPEVWQGHKNGGEGFWKALSYLEKTGL